MTGLKFVNGKQITIYQDEKEIAQSIEDLSLNIQQNFKTLKDRIKELELENEALKSEYYKDYLIAKQEDELKQKRQLLRTSFIVSEEDWEKIHKWQQEHLNKYHNGNYKRGAIGGNWIYEFIGTSIGDIGTCICSTCRQSSKKVDNEEMEFTFQELF